MCQFESNMGRKLKKKKKEKFLYADSELSVGVVILALIYDICYSLKERIKKNFSPKTKKK